MPQNPVPAPPATITFAPVARPGETPCMALDPKSGGVVPWVCRAASGHLLDHASYRTHRPGATPVHTWPQISEVGTLTPEEIAALEVARAAAVTTPTSWISPALAVRLIAIIDRLAGITQDGQL